MLYRVARPAPAFRIAVSTSRPLFEAFNWRT
jgi:hypothetical protein